MLVVFLPEPDGDTIAQDDILGTREGRFVVRQDGRVLYLHPSDPKEWLAGETVDHFKAAAQAWNTYMHEVAMAPTRESSDNLVEGLRSDLERVGVLSGAEDSLWNVLFEQTKDELL